MWLRTGRPSGEAGPGKGAGAGWEGQGAQGRQEPNVECLSSGMSVGVGWAAVKVLLTTCPWD